MATKNPRLQVVLDPPIYRAVACLAKDAGVSMSLKARDLIREAIEHLEDLELASIVADRVSKPGKLIKLSDFEKRFKS